MTASRTSISWMEMTPTLTHRPPMCPAPSISGYSLSLSLSLSFSLSLFLSPILLSLLSLPLPLSPSPSLSPSPFPLPPILFPLPYLSHSHFRFFPHSNSPLYNNSWTLIRGPPMNYNIGDTNDAISTVNFGDFNGGKGRRGGR